jgi:hypothetical protein
MTSFFLRAAAALGVALTACSPAWAAGAPAPAAAPAAALPADSVIIPFNPPVGQKLLYRYSPAGRGRIAPQIDMIVEFRKAGDGAFVMTVTYLLPPGAAQSDPTIAVFEWPLSFRVSSKGEIVGIEDEAAYWARLKDVVGKMSARDKDPGGKAIMDEMLGRLKALPDADRLRMMTSKIEPLLAYSATAYVLGRTAEAQSEEQTALGLVTPTVRQTLVKAENGIAFFVTVSSAPAAQLEAMMAELGRSAPAGKPRPTLRILRNEIRRDAEVDAATGLTRRVRETRTMSGEEAGKPRTATSTTTLERIS